MRPVESTVIFMLGVGTGVMVTWMTLKDKYEKLAKDEIQAVRDYYKKNDDAEQKNGLKGKLEPSRGILDPKEEVKNSELYEKAEKAMKNYSYNSIAKEEAPVEIADDFEIYGFDEYQNVDDLRYEHVAMTFYRGDDTLGEDGIDDPVDIWVAIGKEALDRLKNTKEEIVCVRNNKLGIDYEIAISDQSYSRDILGIEGT